MEKKHAVIDNAAEKRYELDLGKGDMALIEYATGDGFVVLTHTEVPPAYEGQGIGKELVLAALEDIRSKGLRVVPQCLSALCRFRGPHQARPSGAIPNGRTWCGPRNRQSADKRTKGPCTGPLQLFSMPGLRAGAGSRPYGTE